MSGSPWSPEEDDRVRKLALSGLSLTSIAEQLRRSESAIGPMDGIEAGVNFDAPAVLRKWPSLHNERRSEGAGPYLLVDGTLDECIREFMAKPVAARHLYEIHSSPQSRLVSRVLSGDTIVELARLRDR
jgi:hypothetical protein